MEIIETSIFTKQVLEHLTDEEYLQIQKALILRPDIGSVIKKSGGLRKLRWSYGTKGKRGGCRIIYYWYKTEDEIYLLYLYPKNEKVDLSESELGTLRAVVERELK